MRIRDVLRLALSALWQQKTRTLLTTLGVVFGSFVLAASLATSQGVQEALERLSHRSDYLRRIDARPQWAAREADIPAEDLRVVGDMDDAKRERVRKALLRRRQNVDPSGPKTPLTPERLRELAEIEHVQSVFPIVRLFGWATFNGKTESSDAASARPNNEWLRSRLVAGRFFEALDEDAAVVNEFLLYRCGITDDDALASVPGKKIRLEFRITTPGAGLNFYMQRPGGSGLTRTESIALDKLKKQLPTALDRFDLSSAERGVLRSVLSEQPATPAEIVAAELPVIGIVRLPRDDELQNRPWDDADSAVFLPPQTAQDLFFRSGTQANRGLDQAAVYVDREENVKAVLQSVRDTGLNAWGMQEFIEREHLMFLLVFGAMTSIAGVALLVAALGIANTMLMSVLERTREIGIMKAVGAGNGSIQLIFLVEGLLIGLFGGGLGLILARLAAVPADARMRLIVSRDLKVELTESLFVFPHWLTLAVISFTAVVTTLAALYPARRAARVNPVTALRHE